MTKSPRWCSKGRKLSGSATKLEQGPVLPRGTRRAFFHIVEVDSKAALFSCAVNEAARDLAQAMHGKLLLVTNVKDLTPEPVIERYTPLADIERGFKMLKSALEIGPMCHRLPARIRRTP